MNKMLLVGIASTLILVQLSGCSRTPTQGDVMLNQAGGTKQLGVQWNKGSDMVQKGEKLKKKGKKMINDGEDKIKEGNKLIKKGNKMMKESERIFNEKNP